MQLQRHYTNYTTPQLQLHYKYNYSCTTPRKIQQLRVRWPTRWPLHRNHPKKNTPTTFQSISGFALPSVIHNNQALLKVSFYWNFRHHLVRYYWQIGHYRRGELLWCLDGRANPLMDRKVFFWEWLQWLQWSPHPQLLDVVWRSAVVGVVVV